MARQPSCFVYRALTYVDLKYLHISPFFPCSQAYSNQYIYIMYMADPRMEIIIHVPKKVFSIFP